MNTSRKAGKHVTRPRGNYCFCKRAAGATDVILKGHLAGAGLPAGEKARPQQGWEGRRGFLWLFTSNVG